MDRFFRCFPKAQVDSFKVTLVGSGKQDKNAGSPRYPKVEPFCETFRKLKWRKVKSKCLSSLTEQDLKRIFAFTKKAISILRYVFCNSAVE